MSNDKTGYFTELEVIDYLGRLAAYASRQLTESSLIAMRKASLPVSYFHLGEQRHIDVASFLQVSCKEFVEMANEQSTIGEILRLCAPFEIVIPRSKREEILQAVVGSMQMEGVPMSERWQKRADEPTWLDAFAELTFKTVEHGRDDFTRFVRNSLSFNWIMTADFCIRDTKKFNDVLAFSVFALEKDIATTIKEFNENVPRDYKETKQLDEAHLKFLASNRTFTFAFILPRNRSLFSNLAAARATIDEMIRLLENKPDPSKFTFELQQWKRVRQEAKASAFKYRRLQDIFLTSALAGIIAVLLAAEGRATSVSFIPDRDTMTESYDGLMLDLLGRNTLGLSLANQFPLVQCTSYASPTLEPGKSPWFDPLIRVPDHIAGLLSGINFEGTTQFSRPKRDEPLLKSVFLDNRNIITVNFTQLGGENTFAHGVAYSRSPFPSS